MVKDIFNCGKKNSFSFSLKKKISISFIVLLYNLVYCRIFVIEKEREFKLCGRFDIPWELEIRTKSILIVNYASTLCKICVKFFYLLKILYRVHVHIKRLARGWTSEIRG